MAQLAIVSSLPVVIPTTGVAAAVAFAQMTVWNVGGSTNNWSEGADQPAAIDVQEVEGALAAGWELFPPARSKKRRGDLHDDNREILRM